MSRARTLARKAMTRRPGRRAVLWGIAVVLLVLLARPVASADSDLFQNIGPASQLPHGALADAYPLGHYQLDHHFSAVKAGVLSGVDVSGIPPTIAVFLANLLWQITAFLAQTTITVFTFAFSLDLLGGSSATGGHGALVPVSRAVRSIYQTTFGEPWLIVAILLAGLWAIYQALVRRRYTETAGSLALSVVLVLIALAFVSQPERTIGAGSRLSNQMSGAFLSLTSNGSVSNHDQAKQSASDQLFGLLVYRPWTVLQFGGLEHCVKTPVDQDDPVSVAVRPLSPDAARDAQLSDRLRRVGEVQADGKTCIDNARKYAPRFLRFSPESDQRDAEYEAIEAADPGKLPDEDPAKKAGGYHLGSADKPVAEAMGKGGQYQRLLLSVVVFVSELGAVCLIGALSIGVILAQVLVLLLLAFSPVALVIAVFPGRGHEFFLGWLSRLGAFLLRKAVYSLILAVLLAVAAALQDATSSLGWLMAFGLQAVFFWSVLLYRKQLVGHLTQATTGTAGQNDNALRLTALYGAAHAAKNAIPRRPSTPPTASPDLGRPQPEVAPLRTGPEPPPPAPAATPQDLDPQNETRSPNPASGGEASPANRPAVASDEGHDIGKPGGPASDARPPGPQPPEPAAAEASDGGRADDHQPQGAAPVPVTTHPRRGERPDAARASRSKPSSSASSDAGRPAPPIRTEPSLPAPVPARREPRSPEREATTPDADHAGQGNPQGRSAAPAASPLLRELAAETRTHADPASRSLSPAPTEGTVDPAVSAPPGVPRRERDDIDPEVDRPSPAPGDGPAAPPEVQA